MRAFLFALLGLGLLSLGSSGCQPPKQGSSMPGSAPTPLTAPVPPAPSSFIPQSVPGVDTTTLPTLATPPADTLPADRVAPDTLFGLSTQDRAVWRPHLPIPDDCEAAFQATRGDAAFSGLTFYALQPAAYLVQATCGGGAYQPSQVFVYLTGTDLATASARLLDLKQYSRDDDGAVTTWTEAEVSGLATYDATTRDLTLVSKSRGLGDCGALVRYHLGGGQAEAVEARAQPCFDDAERQVIEPHRWPRVREL